jgi:hypothetical protein
MDLSYRRNRPSDIRKESETGVKRPSPTKEREKSTRI